MSETLNDENAAGNDDVSERRAVEHRALEQCDVVHHGVVSGCPVNSCAAVLNEVMSQTGWNAYELAQRTGLDRSAIVAYCVGKEVCCLMFWPRGLSGLVLVFT